MLARIPMLAGYSSAMLMAGLMAFLSVQGSESVPIESSLQRASDGLTRLTVAELLARMSSKPSGDQAVPAEMRRRAESGFLSDDDWRQALLAGGVIHVRARWPAGEPFGIWIKGAAWLRRERITLRAITPDLGQVTADNMRPSWCGTCQAERETRNRRQVIGALPAGTKAVDFEVTIVQCKEPLRDHCAKGHDERALWQGRLQIPVEAVDGLEAATRSVSDPALTASIRRSIRGCWWEPQEGEVSRTLAISAGGEYSDFPEQRGVGVSLELELRHKGTSVVTASLVAWSAVALNDPADGLFGGAGFEPTPEELTAPGAELEGWEFQVTGTPKDTLNLWGTDRWWRGQFSMPLAEAFDVVKTR